MTPLSCNRMACAVLGLLASFTSIAFVAGAPPVKPPTDYPSVDEARGRARLLHETLHATLQIVHHEYYREDEGLKIPAATMQKVFRAVAERQQVELRWLAVNAEAMNADHKPQDDFEKQVVAALSSGKDEHERIEGGKLRWAGPITLTSDCLKCHAPTRTSNQDKAAALVISIPLQRP